jgi:hypothetical protein
MTAYTRPIVRGLLLCGLLSSVLYVVIDLIGAVNYPGYDYFGQAISEMSAIGAPTVRFLAPFYRTWSLLFLAFAAGVWLAGRTRRPLRWSAGFMVAVAVVGSGFSLFPMNERSAEPTFSDTMHLVIATATMLLLSAAILSGARAFGRGFRRYSAATVAVMLIFFALTMRDVPNVAADLPTPYMGLNERVSMAAWLLWIAVLSVQLLLGELPEALMEGGGAA